MNQSNTFGKKRLIKKFYEGEYENKNVQVPENNNSSDKKSHLEFQTFWWMMFHSEAARCSTKINVLKKNKCSLVLRENYFEKGFPTKLKHILGSIKTR